MNKARSISPSLPLPFRRGRKRGGCRFTLIAAVSLDGRITRGNEEGSEWTSPEDQQWFKNALDRYDALIMGCKTFDVIPRPLTPRNRIVFTHRAISPKKGSTAVFGRWGVFLLNSPTIRHLRNLLTKHDWRHIAVLGGTQMYDWFLKRNLVSEIYLTLEPVIFGSGKPLSSHPFRIPCRFRLLSAKHLNSRGTLLLHYKID